MRVVFGFPIYISLAFHCVRMNWLGRVIYTLAEFLFYILVCITLRWTDKKSASHTSCLHPHTSNTSFFYILMLLILLVIHSRLHNIKMGRQKVCISYFLFTFSCITYFFFYILMLLILLVLHSCLHNIKQGRQKVRISSSVS